MAAKFCGKCGNGLKEGAKFCPKCGWQVNPNQGMQTTNSSIQPSMQTTTQEFNPYGQPPNTGEFYHKEKDTDGSSNIGSIITIIISSIVIIVMTIILIITLT